MYLTLDEIKNFGVETINKLSDEEITNLIKIYSGVVDDYCNTRFVETEQDFLSDVVSKIKAPKTPLLSIIKMTYKDKTLTEDVILEDNEDYFAYQSRNIIEINDTSLYKKKKKSIHINFTYGFLEIPQTVKLVVLELIKLKTNSSNKDDLLFSESFDGEYMYQKNNSKTTTDYEKDILSKLDIFKQEVYEPIVEKGVNIRVI